MIDLTKIKDKNILEIVKKEEKIKDFYDSFFNLYSDIGKKTEGELYQDAFLCLTILTLLKYSGQPKANKLNLLKQLRESILLNKF